MNGTPSAVPAPPNELRHRGRRPPASRVAYWIAGVVFLCVMYFPNTEVDWYQEARLDTTLALVNHGTLAIDDYQANTGDKTYYRGHFYSITAPGLSLASVPVVWALERLPGLGPNTVERSGTNISLQFWALRYISTLATVTLPALWLLLLFFWFLGRLSLSLAHRAFATVLLALTTGVFPYAQALYAHLPATALLFTAFCLIFALSREDRVVGRAGERVRAKPRASLVTAGLMLGTAVLIEYQAVIIAALIGLYAVRRIPARRVLLAAAATVPPLLVVLGCNYWEYHNPLITGYGQYSVLWHGRFDNNAAGLAWPPKLAALTGMTFDPFRGIFILSPVLLLAVLGYRWWPAKLRAEGVLFAAVPVLYLIFIAMIPFWDAGSTVGPRYLIPAVPFLAAPLVCALDRARSLRVLALVLGLLSLANVWVQTLAGAGYPSETYRNPLFDYSLPNLLAGRVRPSFGSALVSPLAGHVVILTLVPLALFVGLWTAWMFRFRLRRPAHMHAVPVQ